MKPTIGVNRNPANGGVPAGTYTFDAASGTWSFQPIPNRATRRTRKKRHAERRKRA